MGTHTYSKRTWLNENDSSSTGSIVAFHGPAQWRSDHANSTISFFEIADCRNKIRLDKGIRDDLSSFIAKLRLLSAEAEAFAKFLESKPS